MLLKACENYRIGLKMGKFTYLGYAQYGFKEAKKLL